MPSRQLHKPHKFDFIPGTDHDIVIALIVALGVVYAGTGGWSRERWKEAAAAAGPPIATLLFGLNSGRREGFEEGYETYNPDAHPMTVTDSTATGVKPASANTETITGIVSADTKLPFGWKYDSVGRIRDTNGRIASKKRALAALEGK